MQQPLEQQHDRVRESEQDRVQVLLIRLTMILLRGSAEGVFIIQQMVQLVAQAYHTHVGMQFLPDSVTLQVQTPQTTTTHILMARPDVIRLDLLSHLRELVVEIMGGNISVKQANARLNALDNAAPLYTPQLKALGIVLFAVGFGTSVQLTWQEMLLSLFLGCIIGPLVVFSQRWSRIMLALPCLAAFVDAICVLLIYRLGILRGGPIQLMIPVLFYFIPGDYLSVAIAELAGGYISAGSIRLIYSTFLLLTLFVGVYLGVIITHTPTSTLFDANVRPDFGWAFTALGWFVFALGLVLIFSIRWRDFGWVVLFIYLAYFTQLIATLAFGELGGVFLGGTVNAFLGSLLARNPTHPPLLVLILGAFFVLTVGSLGLRGLTTWIGGNVLQGFHDVFSMLSLGLLIGHLIASLVPAKKGSFPAEMKA
jgi:uncharacterized membrane protein YjjP (DUF1212 family)/uncharacterized membrane protein YjjB (DUF3815 family)